MNMRDWAKREIEIATKREDADNDELDYRRACFESAYKAFECLLEDDHSGMSIKVTQSILNRLINHKVLTPIEDTPDIWAILIEILEKTLFHINVIE